MADMNEVKHKPEHVPDDEKLSEMGFVRCYHPRINETHLADYILVPFDQVYEHTKQLYLDGMSDGQ